VTGEGRRWEVGSFRLLCAVWRRQRRRFCDNETKLVDDDEKKGDEGEEQGLSQRVRGVSLRVRVRGTRGVVLCCAAAA